TTTAQETYEIADVAARYVRLFGHGNSANTWNSFTEVDIFASDGPPEPPTPSPSPTATPVPTATPTPTPPPAPHPAPGSHRHPARRAVQRARAPGRRRAARLLPVSERRPDPRLLERGLHG